MMLAASGEVMRQTLQALAAHNVSGEKELRSSSMHCYAPSQPFVDGLSQIAVEPFEFRRVLQAPFPR